VALLSKKELPRNALRNRFAQRILFATVTRPGLEMGSPEDKVPHDDPPREAQSPTAADSQPPDSFWARIKRHKVVEWTLAYVAFGYATLHLVEMLRDAFEWSAVVPRLTVFGLVLGAPVAVTLAWYHGHRAQHRVSGRELSILIALLLVAGSVLWLVSRHERAPVRPVAVRATSAAGPGASEATFSPPPRSVAVLPFVNLSGDKEQEYFSDGLTEELLNSLAQIDGLQVAARTSSFSFREHPEVASVARKLNVATVLEGSVRRSANTVRVTAQLINAATGFHQWSKTYDRDLGDVLKLQTEIATAVASALKVTLLSDVAARIELGGTRNPAAFDAYLRGSKALNTSRDAQHYQIALAAYTEAIGSDPHYALALAGRSIALSGYAGEFATGFARQEGFDKAQADAHKALALAPELAEGHLALAEFFDSSLEFASANEEFKRAAALAPGHALVLRDYGRFTGSMGRSEEGIAAARRAVVLDPLNAVTHFALASTFMRARRYEDAATAAAAVISLDPDSPRGYVARGFAYYELGNFQGARSSCEVKPEYWASQWCLAITYDKLGRRAEAEAVLAKLKAAVGDASAYQYATIYAQWGDTGKALEWLETAMRLHDPGLIWLKTDPRLDPLRKEPRFQTIQRELKFPD
jgi:serine/threonine-protein kinase